MSIETLTTDEFMELSLADHAEAIILYEREVGRLTDEAKSAAHGTPGADRLFDKMCSYLTIRKVHKGRMEEMQEEVAAEANGSSVLNPS
ncbi:hypothetical protein [Hymenobacter sp.]|uniref:hypothetical protein n=1 Tax=Hymenobacter sp. TaxID=1898978 RepID=UPI00286B1CC6|nr:hypothetical protein [Hymenobacter sp.]